MKKAKTVAQADAKSALRQLHFKPLFLRPRAMLAAVAAVAMTPASAAAQDASAPVVESVEAAPSSRASTWFNTVAPLTPASPLMASHQLDIQAPRWSHDNRFAELVLDANTGEIVYERNGMQSRYIASMNKVMTAYLVFQAIDQGRLTPDTMLTASPAAANILRRTMRLGVRSGQQISVDEALHAMIGMSAGDAAVMLAEAVAGSEDSFAVQMTNTAHRFGARNSSFGTASGITGDQSTAYDIALIFSRVSRDFPALYTRYFSPPSVSLPDREMPNCRLCDDGSGRMTIGATGQKTGTRDAAGCSIVVQIENGDRRYIVVAMGAPSPTARMDRAIALSQAVWNSPAPVVQSVYMAATAQSPSPN